MRSDKNNKLCLFFFFNDTATTEIYTLSLHERSSDLSMSISDWFASHCSVKETQAAEIVRSEEHTSELQSRSDLVCRLLLEKKHWARVGPSPPTCASCGPTGIPRPSRTRLVFF